jgi:type I restriction enzyme S subunit
LPKPEEQQKIADLLTLIDQRISIQNRVIEDLKQLKAALCDRLYDESHPNCRIGDIIEQLSVRNKGNIINVLSVSNRYGFISQTEQFEERSIASEDTTGYKVVSLNDFAYNPARINVGSIARLKSIEKGIVSPMYTCFRCKEGTLPGFLEQFFGTKYFSLEVEKRLEGSVRLCLSFEGLCNIPINLPSYSQQKRISEKLKVVKGKVHLEENYLDVLLNQKQYLLSHLFI